MILGEFDWLLSVVFKVDVAAGSTVARDFVLCMEHYSCDDRLISVRSAEGRLNKILTQKKHVAWNSIDCQL